MKRRVLIGLGSLTLVAGATGALAFFASLAGQRAEQRADECLGALQESGEGEAADCRQSSAMSSLARIIPGVAAKARQREVDLDARILDMEMKLAAIRDLDPLARDRAARARAALDHADPPPGSSVDLYRLADMGAWEVLVESDELGQGRGISMALMLGDWDSAARMTKTPGEGAQLEQQAIVACILGDHDTASARLRALERDYEESGHHSLSWKLRLIELHCGLRLGSQERLDEYGLAQLKRAQGFDAGEPILDTPTTDRRVWALTVAQMAKAQTEPLEWNLDRHGPAAALLEEIEHDEGPTMLLSRYDHVQSSQAVFVEDLERGARRLVELAGEAPLEHHFDPNANPDHPRAQLLRAAWSVAATATAERLWRGQSAEAQADYLLVRELLEREELVPVRASLDVQTFGLHTHLDAPEALRLALAWTDETALEGEPGITLQGSLWLALVLEQGGEFDRAIATAKPAYEFLPRLSSGSLVDLEFGNATRWIYGSLHWRAGQPLVADALAPAKLMPDADSAELFAYWWTALHADPAAQAGHRWRSRGDSGLSFHTSAWFLPVALELIARSAPEASRETWLDAVSSDLFLNPLSVIRIRRDVAERLGDTASAEEWREREAGLLSRVGGDRGFALLLLL